MVMGRLQYCEHLEEKRKGTWHVHLLEVHEGTLLFERTGGTWFSIPTLFNLVVYSVRRNVLLCQKYLHPLSTGWRNHPK